MTLPKRAALALLIAYSAVHFAYSGVITPLASPNIRQIAYEIRGLIAYMASGQPIAVDESDQYGPAFLFIMHPMLRACSQDAWPLSRCAYAFELAMLVASFAFTFLSLRLWLRARTDVERPPLSDAMLLAVLLTLWLNYSPLYYIVTTKAVEMWELALMMAALYAYLRRYRMASGLAIAMATFMKVLPGLFMLYFAFRDRRALLWSVAGSIAILASAELLYGRQMGFAYPVLIAKAAVTTAPDAAVGLHTNLAMRNLVVKAFGDLQVPTDQAKEGIGYTVTIDREQLRTANMLGLALHAVALWCVVAVIAKKPRDVTPGGHIAHTLWDWAFLSTMMLVVAPAATYEYMLLAIFGFSFALVWLLSSRRALRNRVAVGLVAVATLLVANILPRSVINELLFIDLLRRGSGYVHLTLSETYQYFGIPLLGLVLLAVALGRIRGRLVLQERTA